MTENHSIDDFYEELKRLINRHCRENESDTPDYILAQFLNSCLYIFERNVKERDRWYGHKPWENKTKVEERESSLTADSFKADKIMLFEGHRAIRKRAEEK